MQTVGYENTGVNTLHSLLNSPQELNMVKECDYK